MGFAVTPEGIRAEQSRQAEILKELPGHQREAPGSNPPPRRMGDLAQGHPVSDSTPSGDRFDPGHVDTHMWLQPPTQTREFPVIRPLTPQGPFQTLGSSMTEQQDMHTVALTQWDAAAAAQSGPRPGNPSGNPAVRVNPDHQMNSAPSGIGQHFRQNGDRPAGNPYLPVPGTR